LWSKAWCDLRLSDRWNDSELHAALQALTETTTIYLGVPHQFPCRCFFSSFSDYVTPASRGTWLEHVAFEARGNPLMTVVLLGFGLTGFRNSILMFGLSTSAASYDFAIWKAFFRGQLLLSGPACNFRQVISTLEDSGIRWLRGTGWLFFSYVCSVIERFSSVASLYLAAGIFAMVVQLSMREMGHDRLRFWSVWCVSHRENDDDALS